MAQDSRRRSSTARSNGRGLQRDALSRKQLGFSVRKGRKVTFHFPAERALPTLSGYVCGIDDFHWMVATSEGRKYLIHKAAAAVVELHDEETYDAEPQREDLERVVGPFRAVITSTAKETS